MLDRALVAHFGPLDTESLGLAVDALAGGALGINGVVERAVAIESDAHQSPSFPVEVFDTAFAEGLLFMVTGLPGRDGSKQGATKALGLVAGGVSKPERCWRW